MGELKEKAGAVFSIAADNRPVPGCTISKSVYSGNGNDLVHFALAAETDISAETYEYPKLLLLEDGEMTVFDAGGNEWKMRPGDLLVTPRNIPVGMRTKEGAVYSELSLRKEQNMNKALEAGKVMKLADLVPYQDGKIVNMDVISNDHLKFVIMAFDAGTGLAEHAAPGEALIFALDGEGIIGYEGKEHPIHVGENFKFDRGGKHFVKAGSRFKMALLLTLD